MVRGVFDPDIWSGVCLILTYGQGCVVMIAWLLGVYQCIVRGNGFAHVLELCQ